MRPWVLVKRGEVFRVDDTLILREKGERGVSVRTDMQHPSELAVCLAGRSKRIHTKYQLFKIDR